jgi:hypothetical protein
MIGDKIHYMGDSLWAFHCPGCGYGHPFRVNGDPALHNWTWNGSTTAPTFSPSLLCNKDYPESRCHSFVTDGKIQFLSDCFHSLKGQTVEIPEWDD